MEVEEVIVDRGCMKCSLPGTVLYITAIDGLCDRCRKEKYDTGRCSCGKPYTGQAGWYVPHFYSYIDKYYHCPECIERGRADYIHKNKRLREIPLERDAIYEKMRQYKSRYRSKRWCLLHDRITALDEESKDCFPGSGFNPRANT